MVEATRIPVTSLGKTWGVGSPELYEAIYSMVEQEIEGNIEQDASNLNKVVDLCQANGVPSNVIASARV